MVAEPGQGHAGPETKVKVKARIFISYSRKDMSFADHLEAALKTRGFQPEIDRSEIYAFEDWWKRIQSLIAHADTIIFVLSPDAVASKICAKEVAYAASLNKRFAPIVFRRVDDKLVPEALARLNFIFFDDEALFADSFNCLCDALATDIGWIRKHTEYGESARQWADNGHPDGLLLRPPALEEAESWIAWRPQGAPAPTAETAAFVAESRNREAIANRRRRRMQALLYALLIGIILGLVGWMNQAHIKEQWRWATSIEPYIRSQVRPYILTEQQEKALKPLQTFEECAKDCPEMIVIPAGEFIMGSPDDEAYRYANEGPQHKVVFAKPFAASKYPVTFDDWDACTAYGDCDSRISDDGWGRGKQPVINVTWDDAKRYAAWLARMTGKPYRLLSESEWEYASRAGTTTAYSFGDDPFMLDQYAWYDHNSNERTHPVGQKKSNGFGLYDVHGNVSTRVADCYHADYYGAPSDGSAWIEHGDCNNPPGRGGAWYLAGTQLRSADRIPNSADSRMNGAGFRLGRTLNP